MLFGKSFRAKKESELINFDEKKALINVEYEKKDRKGSTKLEVEDKKTFYLNGVKQSKISDIIGKINIVIFTPEDIEIIKEGPQKRRRFLDMLISSLKPNYIYLLNNYNKILEQRNNYLKKIKNEKVDENLLEIWESALAEHSYKIYEQRKFYIEKISEKIETIHNLITKCGKENIKIKYITTGKDKESFLENLKKSRKIDIKRGFTSTGIHRDDFIIYINGKPVSVFGSQGQQRTSILTLKLCELEIIRDEIGEEPILLLDDFMSELDEKRINNFLENIKGNQVILTCTDKIELENEKSIFYVEEGICKKI